MDALATALLRRKGQLYLPEPASVPPADGNDWVRLVEIDLAERGWFLAASARSRLAQLERHIRGRWADWILATADQSVGAHRMHTPLFRSFPKTPANTDALFVERLLAHWFQDSDARCVLCGEEGTIRPVDPCGHLVCERCFDPQDYSACPICGRRSAGGGVLSTTAPRPAGAPLRLTLIYLGDDVERAAMTARDELVRRPGALGEQERTDLRTFVEATTDIDLSWVPTDVASRETLALVSAWALQRAVLPSDLTHVLPQISGRWQTTTDIARTLWAYSGGDAGLVLPARQQPGPDEAWRPPDEPAVKAKPTRVRALSRPVRRAVLQKVESLGAAIAAEDMNRHPTVWKRLAERLHPYENIASHPEAAVAFAALRSTRAEPNSPLGSAIETVVPRHDSLLEVITHPDGRLSVRARTFAAVIEEALDAGDLRRAVNVLRGRPGELWRRVDHLSRVAGDDSELRTVVAAAARDTAASVSPGVLAAAAAELNGRESTVATAPQAAAQHETGHKEATTTTQGRRIRRWLRLRGEGTGHEAVEIVEPPARARPPAPAPGTPRRVFFPRGNVARSWTEPERRAALPQSTIAELQALVDRELTRRSARLQRFDIAILDAKLLDVPAPTRARASSSQLAGWTRGTRLPMPELDVLRLFLHWVELPTIRVDLDLSCAFYRDDWSHAGHCDYTSLRFSKNAAIHSGDFTSAPAPFGATEFLDLTVAALAAAGVRYAVPVVFSYNDVPFERLPEAFAGFALPSERDAQFDAGRVVQRFDLRGETKMLVPFILDVRNAELLWIDVHVTSRGYGHRAGRHSSNLARLGADLWDHFTARTRPTMLDLGAWHAISRADDVYVVDVDGRVAKRIGRSADPAEMAAWLRRAATAPQLDAFPDTAGRRVFAVVRDAAVAGDVLGNEAHQESVAVAPVGRANAPWFTVRPEELLAGLNPTP